MRVKVLAKPKIKVLGSYVLQCNVQLQGVNWLNIESRSKPSVIQSSIETKGFRISSLVPPCPGPSLSKVW